MISHSLPNCIIQTTCKQSTLSVTVRHSPTSFSHQIYHRFNIFVVSSLWKTVIGSEKTREHIQIMVTIQSP